MGRLSEVDNRAVDSSMVLLSSHLNLSSPAFISGALVCSPLLPRNLVFVVLASCLECVLLLTPVPCLFLAPGVFSLSVWPIGLHAGLTPGGWASSFPTPRGVCGWLCPLVCLSALSLGVVRCGCQVFSLGCIRFSGFARSSRAGCIALFLFSRVSFVSFSFQIPWLCYAFFFGRCLSGCLVITLGLPYGSMFPGAFGLGLSLYS